MKILNWEKSWGGGGLHYNSQVTGITVCRISMWIEIRI